MKYTAPIPFREGYVELSYPEFEKLLARIDNMRAERDAVMEALRQQSRNNHELIKAIAESQSVRDEPPMPVVYEFQPCLKAGCKKELWHSGPHLIRR